MPGKLNEEIHPKRGAILDAARILFTKKGYGETTIAEIAQAAGVAVGTVYLYFRNKHEIYTGVAIDLEATLAVSFRDPALFNLPIAQIPRAMIEAAFRVSRNHVDQMCLLQVDMQSSEEVLQHKKAKEEITNALDAFFQHAIAQGQLAPFNTAMYAQLLNLLGSAILHQCFALEKGEREDLYREYAIELFERLLFGRSLREGTGAETTTN